MDKIPSVMILDDEPIVCERLRSTLEKVHLDPRNLYQSPGSHQTGFRKKIPGFNHRPQDEGTGRHRSSKRVKQVSPETQVIIITGFATVEKAKEALKIGAYDFIAKPFKLSQLRDLVVKAIGLSS